MKAPRKYSILFLCAVLILALAVVLSSCHTEEAPQDVLLGIESFDDWGQLCGTGSKLSFGEATSNEDKKAVTSSTLSGMLAQVSAVYEEYIEVTPVLDAGEYAAQNEKLLSISKTYIVPRVYGGGEPSFVDADIAVGNLVRITYSGLYHNTEAFGELPVIYRLAGLTIISK